MNVKWLLFLSRICLVMVICHLSLSYHVEGRRFRDRDRSHHHRSRLRFDEQALTEGTLVFPTSADAINNNNNNNNDNNNNYRFEQGPSFTRSPQYRKALSRMGLSSTATGTGNNKNTASTNTATSSFTGTGSRAATATATAAKARFITTTAGSNQKRANVASNTISASASATAALGLASTTTAATNTAVSRAPSATGTAGKGKGKGKDKGAAKGAAKASAPARNTTLSLDALTPVQLIIGTNSTTNLDRIVFTVPPNQPFVWTNFREGHFSLTYMSNHLFTFGVSKPTEAEQHQQQQRFRSVAPETPEMKENILYQSSHVTTDSSDNYQSDTDMSDLHDSSSLSSSSSSNPSSQDMTLDDNDFLSALQVDELMSNTAHNASVGSNNTTVANTTQIAAKNSTNNATNKSGSINPYQQISITTTNTSQPTPILTKTEGLSPDHVAKPRPPSPVVHDYLNAGHLVISGTLSASQHSPIINEVPQWSLLYHDDFETNAWGWSDQTRAICSSDNIFLGGYCKYAEIEVTKTYQNLPTHNFVRLQANYHFFDRWEGQWGFAKLENNTIWTDKHHHCPKVFSSRCAGIHVCGDESYSDRLSTVIDITLPHTSSNVTVNFGSTLTDKEANNGCIASYGVDDVKIWILKI